MKHLYAPRLTTRSAVKKERSAARTLRDLVIHGSDSASGRACFEKTPLGNELVQGRINSRCWFNPDGKIGNAALPKGSRRKAKRNAKEKVFTGTTVVRVRE